MPLPKLPQKLATQYQPEFELGTGASGTVYRARQLALDRPVALKILHPKLYRERSTRERFLQEARVAARLSHPAIVPVLDHGIVEDVAFIAFPLIEGEPMRALARKGPLPWPRAAVLVMRIAEALAAIHEAGIIHRDLKPENVMIDLAGEAHVTDFGLSRPEGTEIQTASGVILGSPGYMAPEVAMGTACSPASDLYALGVIFWELLAGYRPFQTKNGEQTDRAPLTELVIATQREAPPLPDPAGAIPQALHLLVLALVAREARDRPGSAPEVIRRIAEASEGLLAQSTSGLAIPRPSLPVPVPASSTRRIRGRTRVVPTVPSGPSKPSKPTKPSRPSARPWRGVRVRKLAAVAAFVATALLVAGAALMHHPRVPVLETPAPPPPIPPSPRPGGSIAPAPGPGAVEGAAARAALLAQVDQTMVALKPWLAGAEPAIAPLVLPRSRTGQPVTLLPPPGYRILTVDDRPLTGDPSGTGPMAIRLPRDELHWVQLGRTDVSPPQATVARTGPALWDDPQPFPLLADGSLFERIQFELLDGNPLEPVASARRAVNVLLPDPAHPVARAAAAWLDIFENEIGSRILEADNLGELIFPTESERWTNPENLRVTRNMLAAVQRALPIYPGRWDLWFAIGWGLARGGQTTAAAAAFYRSLLIWPDSYWSYWHLGGGEYTRWMSLRTTDPAAASVCRERAVLYLERTRELMRRRKLKPLNLFIGLCDQDLDELAGRDPRRRARGAAGH